MTLQLVEDALGDARNAEFLAVASELAYMPDSSGVAAFKEQLGLDVKLLSVSNTQVYVGQNDDHIVAAFRGTEGPTTIDGLKDWFLTDAMNLLIIPEGRLGTDYIAAGVGARFHKGFMTALADIWDPLEEAVKAEVTKKDRPLWLTGHSLGGALALLAAWRFDRRFMSVHQIYTYGAPMVGNAVATESFDKAFPNKIYRFVNGADPVPKLPTLSLIANDYGHCLKEIALGAAEATAEASESAKSFLSRTVNGVLSGEVISEYWQGILSRVSAHGLDTYRKLMRDHYKA